jgi:hypothetical protein
MHNPESEGLPNDGFDRITKIRIEKTLFALY